MRNSFADKTAVIFTTAVVGVIAIIGFLGIDELSILVPRKTLKVDIHRTLDWNL